MALKKRGLGRSLDALLGDTLVTEPKVATQLPHEGLQKLPITQLQPGKYQPRKDIDQESLEELANSIRSQGIIQPVVVRMLGDKQYEIVAGERRWRAAKQAGLKDVPVVIKSIPDEVAVVLALIENIQREDLNPMEEAMALQRLIDEFAMTHQEVADAVGKSRATVSNLLRLMALEEEVKTLLSHGDLEFGHAKVLLALKGEQQIKAANNVVNKGLSVRETEGMVRLLQSQQENINAPKVAPPQAVEQWQAKLRTHLGKKVKIQHQAKGKGKIVIPYEDVAELDRLLEQFVD